MTDDSHGGTMLVDDTQSKERLRLRGRNSRRRMFIDICFNGEIMPINSSRDQSGHRPRQEDIMLRADYKSTGIQTGEYAEFSHGVVGYGSSQPVKSYDGLSESCSVERLIVDGDASTPSLEDVLQGLDKHNRIRGRIYIHNGFGYVRTSVEEIAQMSD